MTDREKSKCSKLLSQLVVNKARCHVMAYRSVNMNSGRSRREGSREEDSEV